MGHARDDMASVGRLSTVNHVFDGAIREQTSENSVSGAFNHGPPYTQQEEYQSERTVSRRETQLEKIAVVFPSSEAVAFPLSEEVSGYQPQNKATEMGLPCYVEAEGYEGE